MKSRPRLVQFVWLALAAGLLIGAALMHGTLNAQGEKLGMVAPGDVVGRNHPELTLLNWLPGGLRAPLVTYWWITSAELKQQGRYHDALQRAQWICALQPKFPAVWAVQAWNMAWNISVETHTPQERWKWIYNGVTLLRDRGIPANPRSQMLYHELAWIYFSKIGGDMDDMNESFKQRWAGIMQRVLGAPPAGDTDVVIAAFAPIARDGLVDKTQAPQSDKPIQAHRLRALLEANPDAAALAGRLADLEIAVDRGLLDAYNRFGDDYSVSVVRVFPPRPQTPQELALQTLLNDRKSKPALDKLLAFVRAQILYNEFKMDPQFMLQMMRKYQAPLDWRSAFATGLYWSMYGIETCKAIERADIDATKSDRIAMFCLNNMTWSGRLSLIANPYNADYPRLIRMADPRFIKPTHEQSMQFIKSIAKARDDEKFDENIFKEGHRNYLIQAIQMLYPAGRVKKAQELFDFLKNDYHMTGGQWDIKDIQEFVVATLNSEGRPIPSVARSQIASALRTSFAALAMGEAESMDEYRQMLAYALRVYNLYQGGAVDRNKMEPFEDIAASILADLLVEPRDLGLDTLLPLTARSGLYYALRAEWPTLLPMVYDFVERPLKIQCNMAGVDFDKAFPVPEGLDEYRAKRGQTFTPAVGR